MQQQASSKDLTLNIYYKTYNLTVYHLIEFYRGIRDGKTVIG